MACDMVIRLLNVFTRSHADPKDFNVMFNCSENPSTPLQVNKTQG